LNGFEAYIFSLYGSIIVSAFPYKRKYIQKRDCSTGGLQKQVEEKD
jgi:hypothetical protein